MGPANSAQREPSMEEILASIRRIIEDSDSARGPIGHGDEPASAGRPEGSVIEVDAFRAELRGKADQAEPSPSPREADVVVRPPAATVSPAAQMTPKRAAPAEPPAEPEPDAGFEKVFESVRDNEAERPAAASAAPAPTVPAVEAGRAAIISEKTGRQVAAAFGELSEAFAASRRRSFDEIAEEMLRPMLQDWLDNNLPTLVERLVREEIERVARGA